MSRAILFALLATVCACGSDRPTLPIAPASSPVLGLFRDAVVADGGADAR